MSGAPSRSRSPLARHDSRNVAELARLTGRLEQPVRGMRGRLAERDAEETLFTIPNRTLAWHDQIASDHVGSATLLHQPRSGGCVHAQSSWFLDAPDCQCRTV